MKRVSSVFTSTLLMTTALTSAAAIAQETPPPPPEAAEEIVVRGVFIPDEKRSTSEISNVLDPVEFQRTGDTDIALALKRVTGLSTSSGGEFVFVRGLNERYQNALLNGLPLPSPEPLRRVTPLDLFGTSVVEGLLVQKTFSPQYPGEFGGGVIAIETTGVPDEAFGELSISFGGDTESNFRGSTLVHDGDDTDWMGLDGDLRDLPPPLAAVFSTQQSLRPPNLTDAEIQEIGRSLPTSEIFVAQEGLSGPDVGFSLAGGSRKYFDNGVNVGFVASGGFDSGWESKNDGIRQDAQFGAGDALEANRDLVFSSSEYTAQTNGHVTTGLEMGDSHAIQMTGLWIHKTTKDTRVTEGENEEGETIRGEDFEYVERTVWTGQVFGEHYFLPEQTVKLDWGVSFSEADREAPFQNSVTYIEQTSGAFRAQLDQTSQTRFSDLADQNFASRVDISVPLPLGRITGELQGGYARSESDRSVFSRNFGWQCTAGTPGALLERRIDFILADQNVGPDRCQFLEIDDSPGERNAYRGELDIDAFYAKADLELGDFIRLAGGARFEESLQAVDIVSVSDPDAEQGIETTIDEGYILPSVTATWLPFGNMQLRGGFSQTVTRPQFRELGETPFVDTRTDRIFIGNPDLVNSEIDNYDVRWEWYFGREQFVTIGGFYKTIENPIEQRVQPFRDATATTFINEESADLWGIEFEFKKVVPLERFERFSDQDLVVNLNYTYSDSEVTTGGADDGRRLQGQSQHLFNMMFGVESFNQRLMLLVNHQGERLRNVGFETLPEVNEKPVTSLDLVYGRNFEFRGGAYELGFEARNLLGDNYEAFQEAGGVRLEFDTYDVGREFKLKLTRSF